MKKLVCSCGTRFDEYNWDKSRRYTKCWKCFVEDKERIMEHQSKHIEGFESQKDFDESNLT